MRDSSKPEAWARLKAHLGRKISAGLAGGGGMAGRCKEGRERARPGGGRLGPATGAVITAGRPGTGAMIGTTDSITIISISTNYRPPSTQLSAAQSPLAALR